jgi:hypothetical protein
MAAAQGEAQDYRHDAKRKNNPEAGLVNWIDRGAIARTPCETERGLR